MSDRGILDHIHLLFGTSGFFLQKFKPCFVKALIEPRRFTMCVLMSLPHGALG